MYCVLQMLQDTGILNTRLLPCTDRISVLLPLPQDKIQEHILRLSVSALPDTSSAHTVSVYTSDSSALLPFLRVGAVHGTVPLLTVYTLFASALPRTLPVRLPDCAFAYRLSVLTLLLCVRSGGGAVFGIFPVVILSFRHTAFSNDICTACSFCTLLLLLSHHISPNISKGIDETSYPVLHYP